MRKFLLALLCVAGVGLVKAADLPAADAGVIKSAGIPLFDKAVFLVGNRDTGYRFATSESPEAVRKWYREKLSSWSVFDQFGSWILYQGKAGAKLSGIMTSKQVSVVTNPKLVEWHKVQKNMTTEIVVMVPK